VDSLRYHWWVSSETLRAYLERSRLPSGIQNRDEEGRLVKPCTKDHNGRHEVCGMVEIYDANGRPHACAAGLRSQYQQELRDRGMTHWDASTQSSRDYRVWEFGIDHPYWNDRWSLPVVTNPCEIDYRKWVDHVVKALGFTMKQHEVFPTVITTPLKYNQLVFVMTLLRHPVEVRDHNLECYRWMVEHKTDPLGTLIGMCLDKPIEEDDDPWIPPSPFYGPVGHGFGDVAIYLSKRLKNILWRLPDGSHKAILHPPNPNGSQPYFCRRL